MPLFDATDFFSSLAADFASILTRDKILDHPKVQEAVATKMGNFLVSQADREDFFLFVQHMQNDRARMGLLRRYREACQAGEDVENRFVHLLAGLLKRIKERGNPKELLIFNHLGTCGNDEFDEALNTLEHNKFSALLAKADRFLETQVAPRLGGIADALENIRGGRR